MKGLQSQQLTWLGPRPSSVERAGVLETGNAPHDVGGQGGVVQSEDQEPGLEERWPQLGSRSPLSLAPSESWPVRPQLAPPALELPCTTTPFLQLEDCWEIPTPFGVWSLSLRQGGLLLAGLAGALTCWEQLPAGCGAILRGLLVSVPLLAAGLFGWLRPLGQPLERSVLLLWRFWRQPRCLVWSLHPQRVELMASLLAEAGALTQAPGALPASEEPGAGPQSWPEPRRQVEPEGRREQGG